MRPSLCVTPGVQHRGVQALNLLWGCPSAGHGGRPSGAGRGPREHAVVPETACSPCWGAHPCPGSSEASGASAWLLGVSGLLFLWLVLLGVWCPSEEIKSPLPSWLQGLVLSLGRHS